MVLWLGMWVYICGADGQAQDVELRAESFLLRDVNTRAESAYRVETSVQLRGWLLLPNGKGDERQQMWLRGEGRVAYTERILRPLEKSQGIRAVRYYHEVLLRRTAGDHLQEATLRPQVRRLVLLAEHGQRAPFSPDGPLTWAELDLVRTDPFLPLLLPGLLPDRVVQPGQVWKASAEAIRELTELEVVSGGQLQVELLGLAPVQGKAMLRMRLSGEVRGSNADGRHVHRLEGTLYYDTSWSGVTYLSVKGVHHLLDEKGEVGGKIEGYFTLMRSPVRELPAELSEAALVERHLVPTADNTLLLFDDAHSGLRFCYPRGWRVSLVRNRQVTLDHVRGAGVLLTVEPADQTPQGEEYLREVVAFLEQRQARWQKLHGPQTIPTEGGKLCRFGVQAQLDHQEQRLEYAVVYQNGGGVTAAARLPKSQAEQLLPELEKIFQSLRLRPRVPQR
jgi:hypothetical protein